MTLFSRQTLITTAILSTLILTGCGSGNSQTKENSPIVGGSPAVVVPVKTDYQALIDSAVSDYLPGVVLRVESPKQDFLGSD